MSRFDVSAYLNTLSSLFFNIGLVVGLYFIFTFFKKLIRQGTFEMKIWELIVGVLLVVGAIVLKFSVI